MNKMLSKSLLGACAAVAMASTANAGGLERGGYNIDLLFDSARVIGEVSGTYVMPQRDLKNVVDINPLNGNLNTRPNNDIRDTESYWVPRVGIKAGFGESVDCLVDYSQPWGAHSAPGGNWAGANDNIETKINSDGISGTCSYKMDVGKGQFRVLAGATYQQIDGFKERLVVALPPAFGTGVGRLDLDTEGYGWRIGGAYEIPEIALRASLVYNSAVKLDDITGTLDLRQIPAAVQPGNPLLGRITNVFGSATMPQSVEFKVQSGIAPGWLAFGSVKWVDWSVLQTVSFCPEATRGIVPCTNGGPTEATSLSLLYRDGWTVSGGIGHKFNDQWSGAATLAWDRGTATTLGTQSDTWTLSAGAAWTPNENVELRLGGAIGILTSGSSVSDEVTYNYGNDLVTAANATLRVKW